MALSAAGRADLELVSHRLRRRRVPLGRRGASARDPPRARALRPPRLRRRSARATRGPGSITAAGRSAIRSAPARRARRRRRPTPSSPRKAPGLHQIPVGPVHAGIIEPGHFRFHASGETVVRLEERLGYVHKGVDASDGGRRPGARRSTGGPRQRRQHGRLPDRLRPRRRGRARNRGSAAAPHWLRALMAELERLANHLGDIGAICNDASFSLMHAHCGILRERVLRAAKQAFGHRLMMDAVAPGGVAVDLDPGRRARRCAISSTLIRDRFPAAGRTLRQHRLAAGPHGAHRACSTASWRGGSAAAASSAAPRAARSTRAATTLTRPTTSCASRCRCCAKATSTRACGCASARSRRACG